MSCKTCRETAVLCRDILEEVGKLIVGQNIAMQNLADQDLRIELF